MKIQKKHIVMTSLVLALATAVYINYQISQARTTSPAKELGAASYVNATVGETATSDEAAAAMALSKEQQDFFASERTKRQNTQDKVIDDAEEILDSDSRHGAYRGARKCRANHQLFYNAGYHRNHCESERLFRLPLLYNRYGCNRYCSEKRA